jgi:hypothetical protein
MFLYEFFRRVCADRGWQYFSSNNDPPNDTDVRERIDTNFCLCPARTFDTGCLRFPRMAKVCRIFLLRDPRDLLVSEFYSVGWIHPEYRWGPAEKVWRKKVQSLSVDEYVLRQPEFSRNPLEERLKPLHDIDFNSESNIVVKYEQMVCTFFTWAAAVLRPFEFRWPSLAAARYAWIYRNEFKTTGESMTHKRQITPGDHRRKLKPETIDVLNQRFHETLTRFGYAA